MIRELPRLQINADAFIYGVSVPGLWAHHYRRTLRIRIALALVRLAWRALRESPYRNFSEEK